MKHKKLVHHFLENAASQYPHKTALIHEEIRTSYLEIERDANTFAHWLLNHGVGRGDRVVVIMANSLEYVISYYGILKAGAVAVPLGTDLKPDVLNPLLVEIEPKVIISVKRFERVLKALDVNTIQACKFVIKDYASIFNRSGLDICPFDDTIRRAQNDKPDIDIDAKELSSIIYTSGSTGKPKGVMLSHGNIVSNTFSICRYLELDKNDIQMVVLPFFYVMGKSLLNTHFAVGGSIVINNKFLYPADVVKQMAEEKVTGFSGVPSTYAYLLNRSPLKKYKNDLPELRYCSQAGGHMASSIKKNLRKILPEHTKLIIMYGATEASARLTYLDPEYLEQKIDSIGKPIADVAIRIVDELGHEVADGVTGMLVASGPNIMQGYWKDPETTNTVMNSFGYKTGDMGYRDPDGFLYVLQRKDGLLKVGGHRVNPIEIEDYLYGTDLVVEATVLGVPDQLLGTKLMALVTPKHDASSPKSILEKCAIGLSKHKIPSNIKMVRSIPKNANGKIDRNKCIRLLDDK